jgi:uncharacterized protein
VADELGSVTAPPAAGALRIDLHAFSRQAGTAKHIRRAVDAPDDWGAGLVAVAAGTPVTVEADLEAVGEGVLVTGEAAFRLAGQCARCLAPLDRPGTAGFQELFVYPGRAESDADLARIEGETLDLEPVVRDAIVLDLPLAPLCDENCAGLCAQCGANLNDDPAHGHGEPSDSRWVGLSDWVASQSGEGADDSAELKE